MGSIPQYQRDRFASSYVGGAQRDDSGALIAGAVQEELVEPIRKNEIQKLKQREDAQTDLLANSALIDHTLTLQDGLAKLQKDYASNPSAYPEAAVGYARNLANKQSEGIADSRVKAKFMAATSTVQRQIPSAAVEWVKNKNEFNAVTAFDAAVRSTALTLGNTTTAKAYKFNRAAFSDMDKLATGIVDDKLRAKTLKDGHKSAIESHLAGRVMEDPTALIKSLNADEYNDIPEFTAELKTEYLSKAESKIRSDKIAVKMAQDDSINSTTLDLLAGKLTFEKIDLLETNKEIPGNKANDFRKALIEKVRTGAVAVAKEYAEPEKYLKLAKNFIDDDIDRAKYQMQVVDIWKDGAVGPEESGLWASLKHNVTTLKGQRDKAIFNAQLKSIMGFTEKIYNTLPKTELTNQVAKAVKTLISNVLADPGPNGTGGEKVIDKTITDIQTQNDPRRQQYKVGDSVPGPNGKIGKVTGFYPNGTPAVTYKED